MILAVVEILASPDNRVEILRSMRAMVGPTLARQGCLACRVLVDAGEVDAMLLMQMWRSRDDLERYVRSELYLRVLAIMECSATCPEVGFHTIVATEGLDSIGRMRKQAL